MADDARGFTLLEMLVALSIISIAALTLVRLDAYAVRTAAGTVPRQINPASPRYRLQVAAWKTLPLWLANRLGPPIARGLG